MSIRLTRPLPRLERRDFSSASSTTPTLMGTAAPNERAVDVVDLILRFTGGPYPPPSTASQSNANPLAARMSALESDKARPTRALPPFSVERSWDADSTPPALAHLSRIVGGVLPGSGARTPTVEAAIVMASLMHDVAYYYGGSRDDKRAADALFGAQIPYFVGLLEPGAQAAASVAATVDVAAVALGGGFPFAESYSWSYGYAPHDRGYGSLDVGEAERVRSVAREAFTVVVNQVADGTFLLAGVLKDKLARISPDVQAKVKAEVVRLAKALQPLVSSSGSGIPGF